MELHTFITSHIDDILNDWDTFAQSQEPAADTMTRQALRDHAREILRTIAVDIRSRQSAFEQREKSLGNALVDHPERSAASIHGAQRQASAFTLLQLSAEYRALRASVLRLWLPYVTDMTAGTVAEITRFNEAIDQALAESIVTFSERADRTRDLFLAILGHDLRAPIATMSMAGTLLVRPEVTAAGANEVGARVRRSALIMSAMVEDLLGYTRTQLGAGLPVVLTESDLAEACRGAVSDAGAAHPATSFLLDCQGDLQGQFDPVRLHQLFTNLLINAAQYGRKGHPVTMTARRDSDHLLVKTINHGQIIPETDWETIFKPLIQLEHIDDEESRPRTSLGLGLFVAREIAKAHGGSIDVKSNAVDGTVFSVRLPAHLDTPPAA